MLAFPVRVPIVMQAGALRLLHASREAINEIVTLLWPDLDTFGGERTSQAWKQVEQHLIQRSGHGNRQERCEMESAERILRAGLSQTDLHHHSAHPHRRTDPARRRETSRAQRLSGHPGRRAEDARR